MIYGIIPAGAGNLLNVLQAELIAKGWTDEGTISTNHKVFKSVGTSGTDNIVIAIDDNNVGFMGIRAGTAYNDSTKILSNPTTTRYLIKTLSLEMPYWIKATKDNVKIITKCYRSGSTYDAVYFGLLNRYKITGDLTAITVNGCTVTAPTSASQHMAFSHGNTFTGSACQMLASIGGIYNQTMHLSALNANFAVGQLPNIVDNKIIVSPLLVGVAGYEIRGELEGILSCQNASVANEDIIEIGTDEYFVVIVGSWNIAVKK